MPNSAVRSGDLALLHMAMDRPRAVPGGQPSLTGAGAYQQKGQVTCPRSAIADAYGKTEAFPATVLGTLVGLGDVIASRLYNGTGSISFGHNAIQFQGAFGSPQGFTLGNSTMYGPGTGPNNPGFGYNNRPTGATLGAHEEGHTYQYQADQPGSMAAEYLRNGFTNKNAYESGADQYARSKGSC